MKKSIIVVVNWSANNLAGSKNPLPLGMGSVKPQIIYIWRRFYGRTRYKYAKPD